MDKINNLKNNMVTTRTNNVGLCSQTTSGDIAYSQEEVGCSSKGAAVSQDKSLSLPISTDPELVKVNKGSEKLDEIKENYAKLVSQKFPHILTNGLDIICHLCNLGYRDHSLFMEHLILFHKQTKSPYGYKFCFNIMNKRKKSNVNLIKESFSTLKKVNEKSINKNICNNVEMTEIPLSHLSLNLVSILAGEDTDKLTKPANGNLSTLDTVGNFGNESHYLMKKDSYNSNSANNDTSEIPISQLASTSTFKRPKNTKRKRSNSPKIKNKKSTKEMAIDIININEETKEEFPDITFEELRPSQTATTSRTANLILGMNDNMEPEEEEPFTKRSCIIVQEEERELFGEYNTIISEIRRDTKNSLIKHKSEDNVAVMKIQVKEKAVTIPCKLCGSCFSSIQAIKCHYLAKHKQQYIEQTNLTFISDTRSVDCDRCKKTFKQPSHLKSHYKLVHGIKLISDSQCCEKCEFSCNSKRTMDVHMMNNHCQTFKCFKCQKMFTNMRSLNNHVRIHEGNYDFNILDRTRMMIVNQEKDNDNVIESIEDTNIQKDQNIPPPKVGLEKASKREKHKRIIIQMINSFIDEVTNTTNHDNLNDQYDILLKTIKKLTKSLRIYHGINNTNNYYIRKRKDKKCHIEKSSNQPAQTNVTPNIDDPVLNDSKNQTDEDTERYIEDFIHQIRNKTTLDSNKHPKSSNSKFLNKDLLNQFFKNPRNCFRLIVSEDNKTEISSTVDEVYKHYKNIWNHETTSTNTPQYPTSKVPNKSSFNLFENITDEEIVSSMEKMNQRSSNGKDQIHFLVWKFLNKNSNILNKIFNLFIDIGKFPDSWKESRTVLLPKDKSLEQNISNLRPITISNSIYRIFSNVIKERLNNYLKELDIISRYQKGFQTKVNGCLEHSYTIKSIIDDARNRKKNCEIFFIDIKSAFDKVSHQYILKKLKDLNLMERDVMLIDQMLKGYTSIKVNEEFTEKIHFLSGVKQGDPISPLLFNLAINDSLKKIEMLNSNDSTTNILAYADDLTLIAPDKLTMNKYIETLCNSLSEANLSINLKKCKSLSIDFNNDNMKIQQNNYIINGETIESLKYNSKFNYLGRNVDLKLTYEEDNLTNISSNIHKDLEKITLVNLPNWVKVSLIKMFIISKYNFTLGLHKCKVSSLKPIDDIIKQRLYQIYRLPSSSTSEYLYISTKHGGLGIRKLTEDKNIITVNSFINLLNTRDERLFKFINSKIKEILGIKDECPTIKLLNELYNFKFSDIHKCSSIIVSSIKELNKLQVQIIKEDAKFDINIIGNDKEHSPLKRLRNIISNRHLDAIKKMQDQGRYLQTISRMSVSNYFLSPFKGLAPEIQEFVMRARINQLPTPANFKKWNLAPKFYKAKCPACVTATYNLSHILNGCARYRTQYTERHNSILDILGRMSRLRFIVNERTIITENPLRPDIQIYNFHKGEAILADVAISSDLMDTLAFSASNKISKYSIFEEMFQTQHNLKLKIIPIIIGSLGTIQKNYKQSLMNIGIPEEKIKKTIKLIIKDVLEKSFQIYLRAKQDFPVRETNQ